MVVSFTSRSGAKTKDESKIISFASKDKNAKRDDTGNVVSFASKEKNAKRDDTGNVVSFASKDKAIPVVSFSSKPIPSDNLPRWVPEDNSSLLAVILLVGILLNLVYVILILVCTKRTYKSQTTVQEKRPGNDETKLDQESWIEVSSNLHLLSA